jgi:hypothetical protein
MSAKSSGRGAAAPAGAAKARIRPSVVVGPASEIGAGRSRPSAPAEIVIRAPSVDALFDQRSPEPLSRRPVQNDARERIVEQWVEHRHDGDVKALVVLLPATERSEGLGGIVGAGIRADMERMTVVPPALVPAQPARAQEPHRHRPLRRLPAHRRRGQLRVDGDRPA